MYGHDPRPQQTITNALPVPARRAQVDCDIPVTARIVWEVDGVEHLDTRATAYTTRAVLVEVADPRYRVRGAWLVPGDVKRRGA